jgi:hypothetical protein
VGFTERTVPEPSTMKYMVGLFSKTFLQRPSLERSARTRRVMTTAVAEKVTSVATKRSWRSKTETSAPVNK